MNLEPANGANGASPQPLPIGTAPGQPGHPMQVGAAPSAAPRDFEIFTLPPEVSIPHREVVLRGQRFAVVEIWLALLTAEEDKRACARAGTYASNALILAKLMAVESMRILKLAPITRTLDAAGQPVDSFDAAAAVEYGVTTVDGTAEGAFSAMHPALRDAVTLAYSEATSMEPQALMGFIKSRRAGTR